MDRSKSHSTRSQGITLISVVLSLAILVTVVLIATQFTIRNQRLSALSRQQFIATNLSREGLELVRAIRDTNQMQIAETSASISWVEGICDSTLPAHIPQTFTVSYEDDWPDPTAQPNLFLMNGFYTHHDGPASTPTPYKRTITADCSYAQSDDATAENKPVHVTISSQVNWDYRGEPRSVVLITKLYDWYE